MSERVALRTSETVAEAVRLADADIISAYPITPQTIIVERLSEIVANGELDAEFILVESEQTAMAACIGASAVGARTFTATCSQGLSLMSEMMFIASGLRLPIIMAVVNRAMSSPINIWNDHSDIMAQRDTGWIQIFVENAQESLDQVLCAYKIAEDKEVLLPALINLDGYILSHVTESVEIPDKKSVEKFLPPIEMPFKLDPDKPITMGPVGHPGVYTEAKKSQEAVLIKSRKTIERVWKEFAEIFGREYHPLEGYRLDGAETVFITAGAISGTAQEAVDILREKGEKVGALSIRLWRPFPYDEFYKKLEGVKNVIVVDRAISFGGPPGPVYSEIRSALYHLDRRPKVFGFVTGLGGRDTGIEHFEVMLERARRGEGEKPGESIIIGLRE